MSAGPCCTLTRPAPDPRTSTLLLGAEQRSPRNSGIGMGVDAPHGPAARPGLGRTPGRPLHVVGVNTHHYGLLRPPALQVMGGLISSQLAALRSRP
ncbi:MAG: hypothetical protein M3519_02210 [Actinomycetota bacterium]|nr:hypothetical protein [Actinomycetota bacterium]